MRTLPHATLFLLSGLVAMASGCASASGHWVEIGGERYTVEIADDDAERARGLMFRDRMQNAVSRLDIRSAAQPAPPRLWRR